MDDPEQFRESFSHMPSRLASESTGSVGRPSWAGYLSLGAEDGDMIEEKRKNLQCSSTRVAIDRTELARSHKDGKTYTAYVINVSSGAQSWNIRRRYTDFTYLERQLMKQNLHSTLPVIPPKRYFGSSKDHSFVEDRRVKLETYLNSLIPIAAVWSTPILTTFLDGPSNTLMYLWNLERMRKMQTMITTMDVQNRDETDELTAELRYARDQVKELQDRVKRMEMLFMQGAAGVASDQDVDGEALRSISIGHLRDGQSSLQSGNSSDMEGSDHRSSSFIEDHIPFPEECSAKSRLEPEEVVEVLNLTQNIADVIEQAEMAALLPTVAQPGSGRRGRLAGGRSMSVDVLKRTLSADSLSASKTSLDRAFAMSVHLQDTVQLSNKVLKDSFRLDSPGSQRASQTSGTPSTAERIAPSEEEAKAFVVNDADMITEIMNCPHAGDTESTVASTCECGWVRRLCGRFDEVVRALQPSQDAIDSRNSIYQYLRGIVWNVLGVEIFPVGSFVGRVFLLEGDLDMTVILPRSVESNTWFVKLNEVLCMAAMGLRSDMNTQPFLRMQVNNISFINAEVKIIKATINNISVDISANQIGAVYAQALVEKCDEFVGQNHLLKRSILIMKAWCANESARYSEDGGSLFGSNKGRLSSYSIIVMMLWVFNAYGGRIHSPLQALMMFLKYYSEFDWYRHTLTVHGAVSIEDLSPLTEEDAQNEPKERFFSEALLSTYSTRYDDLGKKKMPGDIVAPVTGAGGAEAKHPAAGGAHNKRQGESYVEEVYMRGILNIIDPVKNRRNITRSVDASGFQAIRSGFRRGYVAFLDLARQCRDVPLYTPPSPPGSPHGTASPLQNADVPFVREFLCSTTAVLKNAGRGRAVSSQQLTDPFNASQEDIESWIRHVELVFSPLSREALGSLVYHILNVKGPVPVGEIGKGLQEMTSNNNITEMIKTEFKGLKRLIELCPEYFTLGTEHPFNPIVSVRPDATPYFTDLSFIVSSLVPAVYGAVSNTPAANEPTGKRAAPVAAEPPKPPMQNYQASYQPGSDGHFYPMRKGGSFKGDYASHPQGPSMRKKGGSFIHNPPQRPNAGNMNVKYPGGHGPQRRSDSFCSATSNQTSEADSMYYGSYVDSSSYTSAAGEYMVPMGVSPEVSGGMMYYPSPPQPAGVPVNIPPGGMASTNPYSPARRGGNREGAHPKGGAPVGSQGRAAP